MFEVQHAMLGRLVEFNHTIAVEIPERLDHLEPGFVVNSGLFEVGLGMTDELKGLRSGAYWCTPTNTAVFAWTGGDGHHYSLVAIDGAITEESAVILTRPDYSDYTSNVVAGENLHDFLCLGRHTGFFNFLYDGFKDSYHAAGHFPPGLTETQRKKLDRLADEFGLVPWAADGGEKFDRLQSLLDQLQFKPETGW